MPNGQRPLYNVRNNTYLAEGKGRSEPTQKLNHSQSDQILGVRNDFNSDPESELPLISGLPINQQVKGGGMEKKGVGVIRNKNKALIFWGRVPQI